MDSDILSLQIKLAVEVLGVLEISWHGLNRTGF